MLVELEDPVALYDAPTPDQPALLCVCRQTRAEGHTIFYTENSFFHCIDDCALEPQLGHWFWRHVPRGSWNTAQFMITISGPYVWRNLMKTLQNYHSGVGVTECQAIWKSYRGSSGLAGACYSAMATVEELRELPWSKVQEVLEINRVAYDAKHTNDAFFD